MHWAVNVTVIIRAYAVLVRMRVRAAGHSGPHMYARQHDQRCENTPGS